MTVLVIDTLNSQGISIQPKDEFVAFNEVLSWQTFVKECLKFIYLNRMACVITVQPQIWSLGKELPKPREIRVNNILYLISFDVFCSVDLLAEIADSEDFKRGLLWLVSIDTDCQESLHELIEAVQISDLKISLIKEEMLICVADGEALWWFNPNRSVHDIVYKIELIAKSFGFACLKYS